MKDKKMAESKIDFSFENLHFSCAGENDWVEKQLNNVLNRIPALLGVHKKGEGVVEEVIEVKEEDLNEATEMTPQTKFRPGKGLRDAIRSAKPKVPKVAKEKVIKAKPVREKIAKSPKSKAAKLPEIAKAAKIKVGKIPRAENALLMKADAELTAEKVVAKRGRKASAAVKPTAKAKEAKKKTVRVKPINQTVDSPLLQYITDKKVLNNQVRKFLATAVFLARNNNVTKLSTPMISKALKSYGIEKLQNASDCLNKNEKKGYCVKEGKEFMITENGYLSIE
jgi:hypothetical protein